ncbi:MAG: GFA family protein [Lentisphaerales bacterium]|nr:MAG: GFA family protein [Lentisphaerales bacterium]
MSRFPLEGGCHCGAVRYVLHKPALSVQHCHCERCRKMTGCMFGTGAVVQRDGVTITGEGNLTAYRSSATFPEMFCKTCGCHLFAYEDSEPTLMYVSAATLDGGAHPGHPPDKESHVYMRSKAQWDRTADDLIKYSTTSPDEIITGLQKAELLDRQ